MSNTYTWTIKALACYPERDGQTNVVFSVDWKLSAHDDADPAHFAMTVGMSEVPLHDPFTPYASLTEVQVIQWVQDALGVDRVAQLKAQLDASISEQVTPTVVIPALPW